MSRLKQGTLIGITVLLSLIALMIVLDMYGLRPAAVLGSWRTNLGKLYTEKKSFAEFLMSLGSYSPIFFILLQALQVVISPIPGELTGVVGGYVYGATFGFGLSTVGLALGSWIAFELARILGKPFVERLVKEELLKKFEFLTTNTGATICFVLFMLPGFPKDVLCYVLGLSRMKPSTFLVLATLGRMPGTFLLSLQGASIRNERYSAALALAGVSVSIIFIAYLYRTKLYEFIRGSSVTDLLA
jgi:uncharacterized membrane protein YdjX (TVP38/TMEM64 family)